jgi:hypothetical protein
MSLLRNLRMRVPMAVPPVLAGGRGGQGIGRGAIQMVGGGGGAMNPQIMGAAQALQAMGIGGMVPMTAGRGRGRGGF